MKFRNYSMGNQQYVTASVTLTTQRLYLIVSVSSDYTVIDIVLDYVATFRRSNFLPHSQFTILVTKFAVSEVRKVSELLLVGNTF